MDAFIFLARLNAVLSRERSKILDQELESDFAILKRQREGESVPPKHYWALKSFPRPYQVSYIKCLAGGSEDYCGGIKDSVLSRELQTAKLVLVEWAERPSADVPREQLKKWLDAAVEYDEKTGHYKEQLKNLCKKDAIKRAFRDCYFKTTGRKMSPTKENQVFVASRPVAIGDARIIEEWDFGGWSHFREKIGVQWEGKMALTQQSICSWLGYFPIGAEGWSWILKEDLEQAAHEAVQQTVQFRDILANAVLKALE